MTAGIVIRNFDGTKDTLLAVDHRLSRDGRADDRVGSKLFRGETVFAAASGDLSQIQRLFSRLDSDRPSSPWWFPVTYAEEEFSEVEALVVFTDGSAYHVDSHGSVIEIEDDQLETIGSGGECLAGAFIANGDAYDDDVRLTHAFEITAHWRDDVSPSFDRMRITP